MNGIVKNYYYTTITTMLYKDLYINIVTTVDSGSPPLYT